MGNDVHRDALRESLLALVEGEETLRLVFQTGPDGELRVGCISSAEAARAVICDTFPLVGEPEQVLQKIDITDRDQEFDLARGPMFCFRMIHLDSSIFLFLTLHHLLADPVTLENLVCRLEVLYERQVRSCHELPNFTSFEKYVRAIEDYDRSSHADRSRMYWREQALRLPAIPVIKREVRRRDKRTFMHATSVPMPNLPSARLSRLSGICLSALLLTITANSEHGPITLFTFRSMRHAPHLSQFAGLLLSIVPFSLHVNGCWSLDDLFQIVELNTLLGARHGALALDEMLADHSGSDLVYDGRQRIGFNYFGELHRVRPRMPSECELELSPVDSLRGSQIRRPYELLFSVAVIGKSVHVHLRYWSDFYSSEAIERLARSYRRAIELCLTQEVDVSSPRVDSLLVSLSNKA